MKEQNLKLSQAKCNFQGNIISQEAIAGDPDKVEAIANVSQSLHLMESDSGMPFVSKIHSFFGMVVYYQYFIKNNSVLAKATFCTER